jgi:hypothetical protein
MAQHHLTGADIGFGGMWTPMDAARLLTLDIPRGICSAVEDGRTLTPEILHFADCTEGLLYRRECQKLKALAHGRQSLSVPHELLLQTTAATLWMKRRWSASVRRSPVKPASHLLPAQLLAGKADLRQKHLA